MFSGHNTLNIPCHQILLHVPYKRECIIIHISLKQRVKLTANDNNLNVHLTTDNYKGLGFLRSADFRITDINLNTLAFYSILLHSRLWHHRRYLFASTGPWQKVPLMVKFHFTNHVEVAYWDHFMIYFFSHSPWPFEILFVELLFILVHPFNSNPHHWLCLKYSLLFLLDWKEFFPRFTICPELGVLTSWVSLDSLCYSSPQFNHNALYIASVSLDSSGYRKVLWSQICPCLLPFLLEQVIPIFSRILTSVTDLLWKTYGDPSLDHVHFVSLVIDYCDERFPQLTERNMLSFW